MRDCFQADRRIRASRRRPVIFNFTLPKNCENHAHQPSQRQSESGPCGAKTRATCEPFAESEGRILWHEQKPGRDAESDFRCRERRRRSCRPVDRGNPSRDAILPYLPSPIRAVVKLQSLTGARGGEILIMRKCDIDATGDVWWYTPESHKTAHHGKERLIPLGSNAQAILAPFLDRPDGRYLFRPAEAVAERAARKREDRKSPIQPSQRARSANAKGRKYHECYSNDSYRRAISYAIRAANRDRKAAGLDPIPEWHPHQLRHAAATAIRKTYGVEVASVMLGHSSVAMTELYAEKNRDLAQRVASEIG